MTALADAYLEAKKRKKTWRSDHRMLYRDVIPVIGRMKAKDVTRQDIKRVLARIIDRDSPIQANRTFEVMRIKNLKTV